MPARQRHGQRHSPIRCARCVSAGPARHTLQASPSHAGPVAMAGVARSACHRWTRPLGCCGAARLSPTVAFRARQARQFQQRSEAQERQRERMQEEHRRRQEEAPARSRRGPVLPCCAPPPPPAPLLPSPSTCASGCARLAAWAVAGCVRGVEGGGGGVGGGGGGGGARTKVASGPCYVDAELGLGVSRRVRLLT